MLPAVGDSRIPWPIFQRGNNRWTCYWADEDYRLYLDRLTDMSKCFGAVHPVCLHTRGQYGMALT